MCYIPLYTNISQSTNSVNFSCQSLLAKRFGTLGVIKAIHAGKTNIVVPSHTGRIDFNMRWIRHVFVSFDYM